MPLVLLLVPALCHRRWPCYEHYILGVGVGERERERERERFIPSHNIVKICSQNHCALQFVRLEEQHGHN